MTDTTRSPGSLVHVRNRDWIVLPSDDEDLLLLKPLGGTEEEIIGIYKPLLIPEDMPTKSRFAPPSADDIGSFGSGKLLLNAARLSFRNASGPFRSIGRLSFRPRAYQMVPLIMALRQEKVRLLIADDVGVGKTVEALLIVKELLERREISRFAVVCLPHLCDQWKGELKDKFDIDAVVIRSNTQAALDRKVHGDESVFQFYPYQVISIDYIKSEQRRQSFIHEAPEMIVVDEVHTCAKPSGADKNQQLRHSLLRALSEKENQHLVMLTATPHSGKTEEFQSLLGLLDASFETVDLTSASTEHRRKLAMHFIQRRRADVLNWLGQDTQFPKREAGELDYDLSNNFKTFFFQEILPFAQELIQPDQNSGKLKKAHYWTALALLRGVMSSPDAGIRMLENRLDNLIELDDDESSTRNPVFDDPMAGFENDVSPTQLTGNSKWSDSQRRRLREFQKKLGGFRTLKDDAKAFCAQTVLEDWLNSGYNPVVFCRYIATAHYIGEVVGKSLLKKFPKLRIEVVTSEDADEIRRERINSMKDAPLRLLIATDCLSEGINLQHLFTGVLHYDLPWNPNRLEQREGRVDRFGQAAPVVKTMLIYGKDNPIDGVVFKVILNKVRNIKKTTGYSVPFPEDSDSIMDTILNSVLLRPDAARNWVSGASQLTLDFGATDMVEIDKRLDTELAKAQKREELSRSIFAQHAIKAHEIEEDLRQADEAIGTPKAVEDFVTTALPGLFGVQITPSGSGWAMVTQNLPHYLKAAIPHVDRLKVIFEAPVPEGFYYLGRNHPFVDQLCQSIVGNALLNLEQRYNAARASVVRSTDVQIQHTLLLLRVRNVIESKSKKRQVVAEEMLVWGFRGSLSNPELISSEEAIRLLDTVRPSSNVEGSAGENRVTELVSRLPELEPMFEKVTVDRCKSLTDAHERYRKLMGGNSFGVVYPVQPLDVLGVYVVLPDLTGLKS